MVQIILTFNTLWCDIVAVTWCRPMYEPLFPRWWPKRPLLEVYCGFWKGESGLDPKVFWTGGGSGLEAFRALLLCARPPPPFSFASHFLLKPKKRMIHVSCNGNRNDNNLNADEGDNEHEFVSEYDDDGDDDLASKELSVELELWSCWWCWSWRWWRWGRCWWWSPGLQGAERRTGAAVRVRSSTNLLGVPVALCSRLLFSIVVFIVIVIVSVTLCIRLLVDKIGLMKTTTTIFLDVLKCCLFFSQMLRCRRVAFKVRQWKWWEIHQQWIGRRRFTRNMNLSSFAISWNQVTPESWADCLW